MNDERNLLVVSGPSGCGKDTVVQKLIEAHEGIELSVSATTRAPRQGEEDGVHYHFVTEEAFHQCAADGALLEYTCYVHNCYGTLKDEVESRIHSGTVCVLVIEVEGAANVKAQYPGCTTVFILPPSMEELQRRLQKRGTEDEKLVQKRLNRAVDEMKLADSYDYQIINEDPEKCAGLLYDILQKRRAD